MGQGRGLSPWLLCFAHLLAHVSKGSCPIGSLSLEIKGLKPHSFYSWVSTAVIHKQQGVAGFGPHGPTVLPASLQPGPPYSSSCQLSFIGKLHLADRKK